MPAGETRDISVRLALVFVATFAVVGLHLPFFPVFLEHRNLDSQTIGLVLAVPLMIRVFTAPAIAFTADRLAAHREVMIVLCVLATLTFALYGLAPGLWTILAVSCLFATVWTSTMPMTESIAAAAARDRGIHYGKVRSFGSVAFILASFAGGWAIEHFGKSAAYWVILIALAATIPAAALLPRPPRREGAAVAPLRLSVAARLLRSPIFLLFLLAITLIQAAHALLYAFGTLHWQSTGISPSTIGLLWALGTGAEIFIFTFSSWPLRRLGPLNLIIIGGVAGTVRWAATALDPPVVVLGLLQTLHALSFGACHLGAVYLMANAVPHRLGATAQGVYAATVGGIGLGSLMMISGPLYAGLSGHAYFVMGVLSALGTAVAILLSRLWDGRPVIDDESASPTAPARPG